jgi:hypothetical protein
MQNKTNRGQSAVEFLLIAPVLFMFFFGILQLFYFAFASFAVQKATNAIARQAASSDDFNAFDPHFQIISALLPLEKINSTTVISAFSTKCNIQEQENMIKATVSYPMPIWVPFANKLFGSAMNTSPTATTTPSNDILDLLNAIGLTLPIPNLGQNTQNVIWLNFEATCVDEYSLNPSAS